MSFTRPIVFWIAMLAAFVAIAAVLHNVLLPFVAGMVLAYLFDPLVSKIERLGTNRLVATLPIMTFVLIAIIVLLVMTLPIVVRELVHFIESLPRLVARLHALATNSDHPWVNKIIGEGLGQAERSIGALTAQASEWFDTLLRSIWSGGRTLVSVLSLVVITPIVALYLLFHWNAMIEVVDKLVPPAGRETVRALAREIDQTIGGFVRGQGALCLILGAFYAVALYSIGLEHGALVGFAAGIMSFIPYLGSLLGLIVSTSIAIAQFWPDWKWILLVPAVFFIGQSLGDYVLSPYLVGRRVHLNPVWVMFALFAFGDLFGFAGLLIAVPVAAAIGVVTRFALRQYRASSLYVPASPAAPAELPAERREL